VGKARGEREGDAVIWESGQSRRLASGCDQSGKARHMATDETRGTNEGIAHRLTGIARQPENRARSEFTQFFMHAVRCVVHVSSGLKFPSCPSSIDPCIQVLHSSYFTILASDQMSAQPW